jgi:predicted N-formylglutamate amidohydrolase
MGNTHLFRSLTGKEEEAVNVVDNRDISNRTPNNKIIMTCDHASNDIKLIKLENHEEHLMRTQEAYDVGAADVTNSVSERL